MSPLTATKITLLYSTGLLYAHYLPLVVITLTPRNTVTVTAVDPSPKKNIKVHFFFWVSPINVFYIIEYFKYGTFKHQISSHC